MLTRMFVGLLLPLVAHSLAWPHNASGSDCSEVNCTSPRFMHHQVNPSAYTKLYEIQRGETTSDSRTPLLDYQIVDAKSIIAVDFNMEKAMSLGVKVDCVEVTILRTSDTAEWQEVKTRDSVSAREKCAESGSKRGLQNTKFDLDAMNLGTAAGLRIDVKDHSNDQRMVTRIDPRRVGWYSSLSLPLLFAHAWSSGPDDHTSGMSGTTVPGPGSATVATPGAGDDTTGGQESMGDISHTHTDPMMSPDAQPETWNWAPSLGVSYGVSYRPREQRTEWQRRWNFFRPGFGLHATVIGAKPLATLLEVAGIEREIPEPVEFGIGLYGSLFDGSLTVVLGRELAGDETDWYAAIGLSFLDRLQGFFTKNESNQ